MSFPGDYGFDRENKEEATIFSLWGLLLSSLKARYTFNQNLVNYQEKWTTTRKNTQYVRKLVVLKVSYNDLDENKVSKDPSDRLCAQAMWRKIVQNVLATKQLENNIAQIWIHCLWKGHLPGSEILKKSSFLSFALGQHLGCQGGSMEPW